MYKIFSSPLHVFLILAFAGSPLLSYAATSSKCPGESGYIYTNDKSKRNPREGGFVSDSANVSDHVFIAPTAAVCGSASVLKFARIYGNAVVSDEAEVTEKARVFGNARVSGTALIGGEAKISDHAHISGETIVEGSAWMRGYFKASSGHFTKGTYKAKKSAKQTAKEKAILDAANAKLAQEQAKQLAEKKHKAKMKREKCERDFHAKRKRLERENKKAADACIVKNCKNYWHKAWGKRLKDNWDKTAARLHRHEEKRVYNECR